MTSLSYRFCFVLVIGLFSGATYMTQIHDNWTGQLPISDKDSLNNTKTIVQGVLYKPQEGSKDDRFRKEVFAYFNQTTLPKDCSNFNKSPPRPVKSQNVYTNCLELRVPNIMHLVWLYGKAYNFTFRQLLSGLSMLQSIKPCCILFWYDGSAPTGNDWKHFLGNMTAHNVHMEMFNITVPDTIWGKKIAYQEHKSDIIRFEVLKHFGGMYMDLDVLILKSMNPLRCYDYTLGRENQKKLTDNLIFSIPHSPFLLKVIANYKNYRRIWAYNSVVYPNQLAKENPSLIHIEEDTINKPSWHSYEIKAIFDKSCSIKWHKNYAIHLWNHKSNKYQSGENPESIQNMTSSFGQIARYIYYGTLDKILS